MDENVAFINRLADPKIKRKFEAFLKREKARLSPKEEKEIKDLERKALGLWRMGVKIRAGKRCEVPACKKTKRLNAHHIESYTTNKSLRYDLKNGICLCPTHHKFGWLSAHRSFCFMDELLRKVREASLEYLMDHYQIRDVTTKERLEAIVQELSIFVENFGKRKRGK